MPEIDWTDTAIGLTFALIFALLAAWKMRRESAAHRRWLEGKVRVLGVVERLRVSEGTFDSPGRTYTPLIVYKSTRGHAYSIDGETSSAPEPALGTTIEVAYDPALPSDARVTEEPPWTPYNDRKSTIGCFGFVAVVIAILSGILRNG